MTGAGVEGASVIWGDASGVGVGARLSAPQADARSAEAKRKAIKGKRPRTVIGCVDFCEGIQD
ncbi:MAG: hypothetical protein A2139_05375 [Desulfobacca sp. RBG_16_60_12]|nr:MAG: hypothetical protein A2139_05375 [Desulfobacca sp. RBG_16_60_12]